MRSLEQRAKFFFERFPQVQKVQRKRGPGYIVDGILFLTTEWGMNKPLRDEEKSWLVESGLPESELRAMKQFLRECFSLDKEIIVERKDFL